MIGGPLTLDDTAAAVHELYLSYRRAGFGWLHATLFAVLVVRTSVQVSVLEKAFIGER